METFEELQNNHRYKLEFLSDSFNDLEIISNFTYEVNEAHFPSKLKAYSEALKHIDSHEGFLVYMTILSALEATEVAETIEEIRESKVDYMHLLEEQADVLIRSMNAMQAVLKYAKENSLIPQSTTLANIVFSKTAKNIERPQKHGGKRF